MMLMAIWKILIEKNKGKKTKKDLIMRKLKIKKEI